MKPVRFPSSGVLAGVTTLVLLMVPTGCVVEDHAPPPAYVAVTPPPVFVEQDDYVYYPRYQVYYGSRSHRYYYLDGRNWVARPAPHGVSVNVLVGSPSVHVGFHDAPSTHHAEIVRSYPRRWRPGRR
ncbi:MAG TPA: hypothetical protein VMB21_19250 [Candidatus Limnocylindria bacterium]|nr:hypothetical protein [Candidatus Limnocylindria bacterium]